MNQVVDCPDCGEPISIVKKMKVKVKVKVGQEIECASCGALLEVVTVRPFQLRWAEEDDYDDDEYDYDEYDDDDDDDDYSDFGSKAFNRGTGYAYDY